MKKLLVLLVALAAVFAIACVDRPIEPVCGEGKITVTPAVWNEPVSVPGHWEVRDYTDPVYSYSCPTVTWPKQEYRVKVDGKWVTKSFGPITFTYDKSNDPNKCHRPTGSSLGVPPQLENDFNHDFQEHKDAIKTVVTPGFWSEWYDHSDIGWWHHDDFRYIKGSYTEGYWTDPVCRDPVIEDKDGVDCVGVYTYQTVEGNDTEKVYVHEWADVYKQETWADYLEPAECVERDCRLQQQGYGLGELWGPDGQYATMYIYPDENGQLPIGIGVGRQQCVLGWEAVRSGHFGFVYKNPCTGQYFFNGNDVTPRPDVLKHGVCARNGACIDQ